MEEVVLPVSTALPERLSAEAEQAIANLHKSMAALGAAVSAVKVPVSPQMARVVQATENAWREIEAEFGMLTGAEVAELLGSRSSSPTGYATDKRRAGKLIGVRRRNAFHYPAFQFDRTEGTVLPVIPGLLMVAKKYGKTQEGLAQWLCAPTRQLDGDRPVDHLHQASLVLEAAENHYGVEW